MTAILFRPQYYETPTVAHRNVVKGYTYDVWREMNVFNLQIWFIWFVQKYELIEQIHVIIIELQIHVAHWYVFYRNINLRKWCIYNFYKGINFFYWYVYTKAHISVADTYMKCEYQITLSHIPADTKPDN